MRLTVVIGTRPEAIKMAPVINEARERPGINLTVISTGQHREMLKPILEFFGIKPDFDLDLMRPDQTLAGLTARAVEQIDGALARIAPDVVAVQGDTTTAMSAALAAFYRRIPVAHVEAGLRTDRLDAPFPEEMNRRVIGQMATWHFAPTPRARQMLLRDGVDRLGGKIFVTGNTVIDALEEAVSLIATRPVESAALSKVRAHRKAGGGVVLVTGHRRENFGAPFKEFCEALKEIAESIPGVMVVYPVHLNPNVQEPVRAILSNSPNIKLLPVVDYPEFVSLMQVSNLIITDSGGVQEEAPWLGVPVIVTRDVTERPEAVESGRVVLCGASRASIVREAGRLLAEDTARDVASQRSSPYGDGLAARRIVDALLGVGVTEFHPFVQPSSTAGR